MDSQIQRLLDSSDPNERIQGIKLLAKEMPDNAITILSAIYKTDSDPNVRDMAVKAGKYIKKNQSVPPLLEDEEYDDDPIEEEPEEIVVSDGARKRADTAVETAMSQLVAGNRDGARKQIQKAFDLNPHLADDPYTAGIAGDILQMSSTDAIEVLLGRQEDPNYNSDKAKRKRGEGGEDDVTWGTAFAELAIFGLALGVVSFVLTLVFYQVFSGEFIDLGNQIAEAVAATGDTELMEEFGYITAAEGFLRTGVIVGSAIGAVFGAFFNVVGLVIWLGIVHFISTGMLSGNGTYRSLIYKLSNFYTLAFVLYYIAFGIIGYIMIQDFMEFFTVAIDTALANPNMTDAEMDLLFATEMTPVLERLTNLYFMAMCGSLLFFVGIVYWTSRLIGQVYDFGTGSGCLAQFISYIALSVFACGCSFIMQSMFMSAFQVSMSSGF